MDWWTGGVVDWWSGGLQRYQGGEIGESMQGEVLVGLLKVAEEEIERRKS